MVRKTASPTGKKNALPTEQSKPAPDVKPRFSWTNNNLIAGLIVAIIGGVVLMWLSHQAPNLRFTKGESFSFGPETGVISVTVINDGSMSAENVECELKFDACKIEKIEVKPTNLKATAAIEKDGSKADVSIPRLNRSESVEISVTATNPFQIDKTMKIAVRGKDVIGTQTKATGPTGWLDFFSFVLIALCAVVAWAALSIAADTGRERMEAERSKKRMDTAPKIFKFLDGSLAGKFFTGERANELYKGLTNRVQIGEETYYIWAMNDNGNNYTFEMACGK